MLVLGDEPRVEPLVSTAYQVLNADISPDGHWLTYQSNESGQYEIYVRPFPGVEEGRWQVSTAGGDRPSWARDGRELFYLSAEGSLMRVSIEPGPDFSAGQPEVGRDDSKIRHQVKQLALVLGRRVNRRRRLQTVTQRLVVQVHLDRRPVDVAQAVPVVNQIRFIHGM